MTIRSGLRRLYERLSPRRRAQLLAVLATMVVGGFAELATIGSAVPFLALLAGTDLQGQWAAGPLLALGERLPGGPMAAATALFAAAALAATALRLRLAWASQALVSDIGHDIAVEVQRRVLAQPYAFHISRNSSESLAALEEVHQLVSGVLAQLMYAATAIVLSLFIAAALVQVDLGPAIVAGLTFAAVYGLLSLVARKRLARVSDVFGSAYEQRIRLVQESLAGIRDIILDQSRPAHVAAFARIERQLADARTRSAFLVAAPRLVAEAAGILLIAGLAVVLASRDGGLAAALPSIGAIALGAQRMLPLVQQVYHSWSSLEGGRAILGKVSRLLELPLEPTPTTAPLEFREAIVFEQVSFAYPGRGPALEDISLVIPSGCRLALAGRTGSGKSTLADLLMCLLEPGTGRILIDGVPLGPANRAAWQAAIAHVPQSIFLADSTIAENIAFGVPRERIAMDRVREAARLAQIDSDIAAFPDGYATRVGERGVRLSGGQRQRLAIARAAYRQAPVLVLDEATSALDEATEAAVLDALDALGRAGRTIVIIAHRASTLSRCERVVTLDGGRIVESAGRRTGTDQGTTASPSGIG